MNSLNNIILSEIETRGPLPFARFMELALYHPEAGYYTSASRTVGRMGDFYTSVSTGPVFGELLAFRLAKLLSQLDYHSPVIVEAGAHDGQLARDILAHLETWQPELFQRITYHIVEPLPRRRARQAETLAAWAGKIQWHDSLDDVPAIEGAFLSNELLDAMPVHQLRWDGPTRQWWEWGVTHAGSDLAWVALPEWSAELRRCPESTRHLLEAPEELLAVLPDGMTVEVSPAAIHWWREAARKLSRGWMVTLDYGYGVEDRLSPARLQGSLRAYSSHRMSPDLLANAGEQDLTAHVDFAAINEAGQSQGLTAGQLSSQARFLTGILEEIDAEPAAFPAWTPKRIRQLQTLIHPQHLGEKFHAFVQERRAIPV